MHSVDYSLKHLTVRSGANRKRLLRDAIDGELEVRTKRVVGEQGLPPSRRQLFERHCLDEC